MMESDIYKKRVDQLSVLVRHYQTELESKKAQHDGVEVVSQLLAESRQENFQLRRNQMSMEALIKNLQNRLTLNGLASTSHTEEDAVIMPGTSKQTLINLVLENKRLRSMLQEPHSTNADISSKASVDLYHELKTEELSLQNTADKMNNGKMISQEATNKSTSVDKYGHQVQFDELQLQINNNSQEEKSSECEQKNLKTYGKNILLLKDLLKEFIGQCEVFNAKLDQADQSVVVNVNENYQRLPSNPKEAVERSDSVDAVDVQQILEEKQKLQERVEDVTKMNQRWQEFYSEREKYIQELEEKIHTLKERLKNAMRSGPTEEISRRLDSVLERKQKEMKQVEDLRLKAEEQVQCLEQELALKNSQLVQLQIRLKILSHTPTQLSPEDLSSTIEHLKAQIQVCTEDFEKERQDRQVALQKIASLQEQNTHLQKQNMHLQKLYSHLQTLLPNQLGQNTRPEAQEHVQHDQPDLNSLQPRGASYTQMSYDRMLQNDMKTLPAQSLTFLSNLTEKQKAPIKKGKHCQFERCLIVQRQDNLLTCPKCNKEFSDEHHGDLLTHIEQCWE